MPAPVPYRLPDPGTAHPLRLPDGTPITGTAYLRPLISHPQVEVGDFTYASDFDPPADGAGWAARLAPYLFPFSRERLVIGRFCQIAHGVRFLTSSANHAMTGPSTYPFPIFGAAVPDDYQPDRRDTVIGNDVWLGHGALVLPGARIGDGVIVGAGAVVGGSVPDYAVVTGNPARVLRLRFSEAEIAELKRLAWWTWPPARIAAARAVLEAGRVADLAAYAP